MRVSRIQSVGDAVGQGFRVCRRDLKFLVSIMMVPTIVLVVGKLGTTWGGHEFLQLLSEGKSIFDVKLFIMPFLMMSIGLLVTYFALFWLLLRQLGYMRMIVLDSNDFAAEITAVGTKKWKILAYIVLSMIGFFVWIFTASFVLAVFLAVVTAIKMSSVLSLPVVLAGMLLGFVSLVAIFVPLVLLFVVLVMEDRGFFGTIGRTFSIGWRHIWALLGFAILSYVATVTVSFALQSPYQLFYLFHYIKSLYMGADNYANSPLLTVPLYLQMLAMVWQSCIFMYLYPVFFTAAGIVYYSIRMKEDGVDLEKEIQLLSANLKKNDPELNY